MAESVKIKCLLEKFSKGKGGGDGAFKVKSFSQKYLFFQTCNKLKCIFLEKLHTLAVITVKYNKDKKFKIKKKITW